MAVTFTCTGATFAPVAALVGGSTATLSWAVSGFTTQNGLTPSFSFGSAANRTCTLTAAGGGGLADITLINLGYDNTIDVGHQMPPAGFVKSAELVTGGIGGLNTLTGLVYLLADHTALNSSLDFTNMTALQFIQCYGTGITGVTLTGCTALIRLQVEASNLTTLDLNPVAANITDVRAAVQQGGALSFVTLTAPLAADYHFCTRDQTVTGLPPLSDLPVIQELWIWNDGQSGALNPVSTVLGNLQAYQQGWTSANLSGLITSGAGYLDLHHCQLASVNLSGCAKLGTVLLNYNRLVRSQVDSVLTTVNGFGTSNGTIDVSGNTAPSAAGLAAASALVSRGWSVTKDTAVPVSVAQVQITNGGPTGAFGSAPAVGDTVILVICAYTTSSGTITSSAPMFNSVTPPGSVKLADKMSPIAGGFGVYVAAWMMPHCGDGASTGYALTVTGQSGEVAYFAYDIAGLGVFPVADLASTGGAGTGTAVSSGPAGPVLYDKELVLGAATVFGGSSGGPAAPWTVEASPGGHNGWTGYQIQTARGGKSYTWAQTGTSSDPWSALTVTIRATDAALAAKGGSPDRHHHRAGSWGR